MVVGGFDGTAKLDTVELISLDPVNHPVPDCQKHLGNFPVKLRSAGGAALQDSEKGIIINYSYYYNILSFCSRFTCSLCWSRLQ